MEAYFYKISFHGISVGIEPSFYLTYNNFLWGISIHADYMIAYNAYGIGSSVR